MKNVFLSFVCLSISLSAFGKSTIFDSLIPIIKLDGDIQRNCFVPHDTPMYGNVERSQVPKAVAEIKRLFVTGFRTKKRESSSNQKSVNMIGERPTLEAFAQRFCQTQIVGLRLNATQIRIVKLENSDLEAIMAYPWRELQKISLANRNFSTQPREAGSGAEEYLESFKCAVRIDEIDKLPESLLQKLDTRECTN